MVRSVEGASSGSKVLPEQVKQGRRPVLFTSFLGSPCDIMHACGTRVLFKSWSMYALLALIEPLS